MHVWWHKTVFIQITKNAALREEEGHAGRQLQTDVNKQPFPTHRADLSAQEDCPTSQWRSMGAQMLQWKEICTNMDIYKATIPFCQLHCIADKLRVLKLKG